jgi:hypothetical protein
MYHMRYYLVTVKLFDRDDEGFDFACNFVEADNRRHATQVWNETEQMVLVRCGIPAEIAAVERIHGLRSERLEDALARMQQRRYWGHVLADAYALGLQHWSLPRFQCRSLMDWLQNRYRHMDATAAVLLDRDPDVVQLVYLLYQQARRRAPQLLGS